VIKTRAAACFAATLFTLLGCSQPKTHQEEATLPQTEAPATFVNRVWSVAESSGVAPGQLYVLLSEGTLVVASPNGTPTLGTWSREDGGLTMVEEGIPYKVDILGLSRTEFRIRSNNPGGSVEIRLVPAEGLSPPGGSS
jgi:hypothetical protein